MKILRSVRWLVTAGFLFHPSVSPAAPLPGINLSAAAFASGKIPGRDGWDYLFPRPADVRYFSESGMKLFRLPFLWERLQPTLMGPLDAAYLQHIRDFVTQAEAAGAKVLLDMHDYAQYNGRLIGSDAVPVSAFQNVWLKLAAFFKNDPNILLGLMNEPKLGAARDWATIEQGVIDMLRADGIDNPVVVSGVSWDSAYNFPAVNGAALETLKDPANALIFEAHQYFDRDSSGRSAICVPRDQVAGRLAPFADWLKKHHAKGLLGEFGVSRDEGCLDDLRAALVFISGTSDIWYGWTYWAAGPLWGTYMFSAQPSKDGQDAPQMTVMRRFLSP